MKPLTELQKSVLEFIQFRSGRNFITPSMREISSHFGWASSSTAQQHVEALKRKGWLTSGAGGQSRTLRPENRSLEKPIPIIPPPGRIAADHGDERCWENEAMVYFDLESLRLPKSARLFALRMNGDSMIGRHIQDGDVILLEQGAEAISGDVVAVLIDGGLTLKTLVIKGGKPWLEARNPPFPSLIPASELVIQGVMRSLVRHSKIEKRK